MDRDNLLQTIKEAYIYGYPLMGMYELLHSQILNPETKLTDFNEFSHTSTVATPKTTFVPAPNNDTTYSRAWLDLRQEPIVIEAPDTDGRFYSIQLLDMFTETIINLGKRLNGTKAQSYLITGPGWNGNSPEELPCVKSKTDIVLAFLRVLIINKSDISDVADLQNEFKIMPLSVYLKKSSSNILFLSREKQNLPAYENSNYVQFFQTLNHILALLPELPEDYEFLKKIKGIGIGRNMPDSEVKKIPAQVLTEACDEAIKQIDECGLQFGESINYWRVARKGIGNYGTDYLQRSVVWFKGALANQPEESLYPSTFQDSDGQFLDGANKYQLTFEAGLLPPVSQFWSLTMYLFSNGFLAANKIDRYSIGDRTKGIMYNQDGSLTIFIQHEEPVEENQKANWLPAPGERFYLTLRLYGPDKKVINGEWNPPAVRRADF